MSIAKTRLTSLITTAVLALAALFAVQAHAADPDPADWESVIREADGQTVYWNAWGGSSNINDYIGWVGDMVNERFGVTLKHVKLDDTANAVATVVAEKATGNDTGGTIDLIWINGENFASMKQQGLLFSPGWADHLPNWRYVDAENKPTIATDFTIPTDGMESPWGGAKLVFFYDSARTSDLPNSVSELAAWAKKHPGRFSYPAPPDFVGSSFLKQALSEVIADPGKLLQPVVEADFAKDSQPLFDLLDQLHPVMWRQGRAYPQNYPDMRQKLADNELDIIFAFNPSEASSAIASHELPDTVRSFTFSGGTLGNTHFVAIPYNSSAKAAALVVANFLISPEAQIRKQNPNVWGDPTVLNIDKLNDEDRAGFAALELGVATLKPEELGPMLPEPHPTWMTAIEQEWLKRYGVGN
jgi:putative thiamine transport system substrate-binding protein